MNATTEFLREVEKDIQRMRRDPNLRPLTMDWVRATAAYKYTYHFSYMDRPLIQFPQDMIAVQELVWHVRPDLIIETGIAHGGSLVMSASMLAMLDYCDAVQSGKPLDPLATRRRVLGVDIDIRVHNRVAIEAHPMAHRIDMIQGSSVAPDVVSQVRDVAKRHERVMVMLDSNHTHDHVLAELEAYAPLIALGSYCVVFDTLIEDVPNGLFADRPWGKGNNPKTAVWEYARRLKEEGRSAADGAPLNLDVDTVIESKLLITVAPNGYLKRV